MNKLSSIIQSNLLYTYTCTYFDHQSLLLAAHWQSNVDHSLHRSRTYRLKITTKKSHLYAHFSHVYQFIWIKSKYLFYLPYKNAFNIKNIYIVASHTFIYHSFYLKGISCSSNALIYIEQDKNWFFGIMKELDCNLCRGRSSFHICGRTRSWLDQWGRTLPVLRHHDECQYQCTALEGGTFRQKNQLSYIN